MTVTGGGGHPASVDARAASILTDPALDNSLTGNASDTIVIDRYAGVDGEIVVRAGLTWHAPSGLSVDGTGVLRLEPGATLVVNERAGNGLNGGWGRGSGASAGHQRVKKRVGEARGCACFGCVPHGGSGAGQGLGRRGTAEQRAGTD